MGYFAYGNPRILGADTGRDEQVLYLHSNTHHVLAVSPSAVQLWSGGLHRVKLSECAREEADLESEGHNIGALWSPVKNTLAVLTSANHIHLYSTHVWKETLLPGSSIAARDIPRADVYLRSSMRIESEVQATCLTGDGRHILIGCADGALATLTWLGKVQQVSYPLDDCQEGGFSDSNGNLQDAYSPRSNGARASSSSNANLRMTDPGLFAAAPQPYDPSAGINGGFQHLQLPPLLLPRRGEAAPAGLTPEGIVQMEYCEASRLLVLVLASGAVALCVASHDGLAPLRELSFGRWICRPDKRALVAKIGATPQLLAVGREAGVVELYRLHGHARTNGLASAYDVLEDEVDPPVRTLSLHGWGHTLSQTGAISQIEWSPDRSALAVGYQTEGLVVWSPSGCRLMCSLRPAAAQQLPPPPAWPNHSSLVAGQGSEMGGGRASGERERIGSNGLHGSGGDGVKAAEVRVEGGVAAMAWGMLGYQLLVAEDSSSRILLELQFAHSLPNHHRVSHTGVSRAFSGRSGEELHVLQAHDRLLVITEASIADTTGRSHGNGQGGSGVVEAAGSSNDLVISHIILPYQYISANWPLQHAAVSEAGTDIAVAGQRGLAFYNRVLEKWRLFGDISQERQVCCKALAWLQNIIVVCSGPDADAKPGGNSGGSGGGYELLLLPRYHLDFTSLLCRHTLSQPLLAMDCVGSHILLASEPLEISLMEVQIQGQLTPTGNPKARLQLLREISILDVGRPLLHFALVPAMLQPLQPLSNVSTAHGSSSQFASAAPSSSQVQSASNVGAKGLAQAAAQAMLAVPPAPRQCVLLRWGGLMSVLDLERGSEIPLSTEVECFWLSDTAPRQPQLTGVNSDFGSESSRNNSTAQLGLAHAAGRRLGSNGGASFGNGSSNSGNVPFKGPAATSSNAFSTTGAAAGMGDVLQAVHDGRQGETDFNLEALTTAGSRAADVEMPWWAYGPSGMQLWFPSSLNQPQPPRPDGNSNTDIELEFDQEVYPVGISLADDAIIGITQRIQRGGPQAGGSASNGGPLSALLQPGGSQVPCFHPIPESQPVLPCLLRRLLQRGALAEATRLARRHERGPHFTRSLEWLLFTALEMETAKPAKGRHVPQAHRSMNEGYLLGRSAMGEGGLHRSPSPGNGGYSNPTPVSVSHLLSLAAELIRRFPQYADVVVSVARKTDAALWPALFSAVGSPSSLLEGLVEDGALASASCCLLVIDRLEGAAAAHLQALRLMRASMARGQYVLCGELLRFIIPPGEVNNFFGSTTDSGQLGISASTAALAFASGDHRASLAELNIKTGKLESISRTSTSGLSSTSGINNNSASAAQHTSATTPSQSQQVSWLGWMLGYGSTSSNSSTAANSRPTPGQAQAQAQQKSASSSQQPLPLGVRKGSGGSQTHNEAVASGGAFAMAGDVAASAAAGAPPATLEAAWATVEKNVAPSPRAAGHQAHRSSGGGTSNGTGKDRRPGSMLETISSHSEGFAPAIDACLLLAEHGWALLEAGQLQALSQLNATANFLGGGLPQLMKAHRDSHYAREGFANLSAVELLSCVAIAVQELPVWTGEEVEAAAGEVLRLSRSVGATSWVTALAVLLVDVAEVAAFRDEEPQLWAQFVDLLRSDASLAYLYQIVAILTGSNPEGLQAGAAQILTDSGQPLGTAPPLSPGGASHTSADAAVHEHSESHSPGSSDAPSLAQLGMHGSLLASGGSSAARDAGEGSVHAQHQVDSAAGSPDNAYVRGRRLTRGAAGVVGGSASGSRAGSPASLRAQALGAAAQLQKLAIKSSSPTSPFALASVAGLGGGGAVFNEARRRFTGSFAFLPALAEANGSSPTSLDPAATAAAATPVLNQGISLGGRLGGHQPLNITSPIKMFPVSSEINVASPR